MASAFGEYREAWQHTHEALGTAREIGSLSASLFGLVSAADLLARQAENERATELAALVFHHPATNQETRDRAGNLLAQLTARMPAPILAAARERGQTRDRAAAAVVVLAWARARLDSPAE